MVRAHRAHGVDDAREPRDVLLHQRALGLDDQLVGDAVDAAPREVVARVTGEHRAVQLERVLARRFDQRALRQREPGRVQQLLQARVLGGVGRRHRCAGGRLRIVARRPVPRLPDRDAPCDQRDGNEQQAPASPAPEEAVVDVQLERRTEGLDLGGAAEELVLELGRQRGREVRAVRPALRRVDEVADALGRGRLVQESKDEALGDERGELVLVVAPARDDDREIRELLVYLGDEGLGVVIGERSVDQEHRVARGDHQVGRVRCVVGAPDAVMAGDRVAQEVDEDRVGRKYDDVCAMRASARLRQGCMRAGRAGGGRMRCRSRRRCRCRSVGAATGLCKATGFAAAGSAGSGASSPGRMSE